MASAAVATASYLLSAHAFFSTGQCDLPHPPSITQVQETLATAAQLSSYGGASELTELLTAGLLSVSLRLACDPLLYVHSEEPGASLQNTFADLRTEALALIADLFVAAGRHESDHAVVEAQTASVCESFIKILANAAAAEPIRTAAARCLFALASSRRAGAALLATTQQQQILAHLLVVDPAESVRRYIASTIREVAVADATCLNDQATATALVKLLHFDACTDVRVLVAEALTIQCERLSELAGSGHGFTPAVSKYAALTPNRGQVPGLAEGGVISGPAAVFADVGESLELALQAGLTAELPLCVATSSLIGAMCRSGYAGVLARCHIERDLAKTAFRASATADALAQFLLHCPPSLHQQCTPALHAASLSALLKALIDTDAAIKNGTVGHVNGPGFPVQGAPNQPALQMDSLAFGNAAITGASGEQVSPRRVPELHELMAALSIAFAAMVSLCPEARRAITAELRRFTSWAETLKAAILSTLNNADLDRFTGLALVDSTGQLINAPGLVEWSAQGKPMKASLADIFQAQDARAATGTPGSATASADPAEGQMSAAAAEARQAKLTFVLFCYAVHVTLPADDGTAAVSSPVIPVASARHSSTPVAAGTVGASTSQGRYGANVSGLVSSPANAAHVDPFPQAQVQAQAQAQTYAQQTHGLGGPALQGPAPVHPYHSPAASAIPHMPADQITVSPGAGHMSTFGGTPAAMYAQGTTGGPLTPRRVPQGVVGTPGATTPVATGPVSRPGASAGGGFQGPAAALPKFPGTGRPQSSQHQQALTGIRTLSAKERVDVASSYDRFDSSLKLALALAQFYAPTKKRPTQYQPTEDGFMVRQTALKNPWAPIVQKPQMKSWAVSDLRDGDLFYFAIPFDDLAVRPVQVVLERARRHTTAARKHIVTTPTTQKGRRWFLQDMVQNIMPRVIETLEALCGLLHSHGGDDVRFPVFLFREKELHLGERAVHAGNVMEVVDQVQFYFNQEPEEVLGIDKAHVAALQKQITELQAQRFTASDTMPAPEVDTDDDGPGHGGLSSDDDS